MGRARVVLGVLAATCDTPAGLVPGATQADTVESHWGASAMVGVTTPVVPRWTPLAITVGVGLTDPKHDWFARRVRRPRPVARKPSRA